MPAKLRQISDFLNQRSSLQYLLAEIRRQQQLLQLIRQKLPDKIARHCQAAIMQGAQLYISVDSPVWASQVRFESPGLLSELRRHMPDIGSIKVRVMPMAPDKPLPKSKKTTQLHCSNTTARHVQSCAEYTNQAELGAALKRLAKAMRSQNRPAAH